MTDVTPVAARRPGFGRGVGAAAAVAVLVVISAGAFATPAGAVSANSFAGPTAVSGTAQAAASRLVPVSQPLVVLQQGHVAHRRPNRQARRVEYVPARRPLTAVRTVLPVLGHAHARRWVRVRLPGRPNGHAGWIRTAHTRHTSTPWRLSLDVSARRVTVLYGGQTKRRFRAVVGTPATPTPPGRYFVEEGVALPGHVGGPFALATSARSNVLQEFEGGPGQIALHGTAGLAGALGSAASHGCIRLGTGAIVWLARRVGGGVPLTIRP
ncbi:MAG TPA: L,D-transpeptidase [Thermoleophilaceae bacterium]|nr:L,D-transpeptidase [Thermoleophilaceae bacterium]